jgi:hypothetical protein
MSVTGLQTPFQRLAVLPTAMNWRGSWVATQDYFLNDVVISPINGSSYILTGTISLVGGLDPSLNPVFEELSPLSAGITGVVAGPGIIVDNTNPQIPIIENNGVRTLTGDGVSIVVDNTDPNNPAITSLALNTITGQSGISVNNANPQNPIITNSGVRSLAPLDASITVSAPTGAVILSANGLADITAGVGIGLAGTVQNRQITNTGVVSLAVGAGLSSTGGVNPTIANTGVLTIAAADSSIIVAGTVQNRTIRTSAPVLTRAFTANVSQAFAPALPGTNLNFNVVVPASPNIVRDYLFSGAPDAAGVFLFDLTPIIMRFVASGGPLVIQNNVSLRFIDGVNAITYTSPTILNETQLSVGTAYPINSGLGKVYMDIADARTAGFRVLTGLQIVNATNGELLITSLPNLYSAEYLPLGLQ